MHNKTEQKINFLMAYALSATALFVLFLFSSFSDNATAATDELIVKKLTIAGEDGLPRIVLSNETRQHPGRFNGKEIAKRERPSGILFFNNQGDECGGLVHQSKIKDGKITSGMSFTMDNYQDDQVVQILNDEYYADGKAYIQRGININQYPVGSNMEERNRKIAEINKIEDKQQRNLQLKALWEKEGAVNRLFIGRTKGNSSGLFLSGPDGKPKMMIYVDEQGNPKIQTLNEKGEVKDLLLNQ